MMESASLSHLGLVRHRNEDSLVDDSALGLWMVADGVGGNGFGDVASQIAAQTVERKVRQGSGLVSATLAANKAIIAAASEKIEYQNMATTIVACHIHNATYEVSWVGDSRAYLIDQQQIAQITSDHNFANALVAQGVLSVEDAQRHPGQHELTQALGHMYAEKPSVSLGELHDGDYLLLCTDGLSGVVSDQDIHSIVLAAATLEEACQDLLKVVLQGGAPDNVSVVLLRYFDDPDTLKAGELDGTSYRLPFDSSHYLEHCKSRPWLIGLVVIAILFLWWAI